MATLLIVDDEADVREFGAKFFQKRKIEVITAKSGEEALELMDRQKPNLVLLDIKMSGMDGIETLRQMKDKNKDIRVIMVTGKNSNEDEAMGICKSYGAMAYIHKPLVLEELERTVLTELNREIY